MLGGWLATAGARAAAADAAADVELLEVVGMPPELPWLLPVLVLLLVAELPMLLKQMPESLQVTCDMQDASSHASKVLLRHHQTRLQHAWFCVPAA